MQSYNFKTKPFKHQADALNESWAAEYYALFMEMGTGKSKVAIDNIGLLYEQGELDAALVIAPKGVYDNWVKGEFPAHLPESITRTIVRWDPKTTKTFYAAGREDCGEVSCTEPQQHDGGGRKHHD